MKVKITLDDPNGLNSVRCVIEPPLNILEKAAKVDDAATPAQVYAMGALNAMKALRENPEEFRLPEAKIIKRSGLYSTPVEKVEIELDDTLMTGGVTAKSSPKFSTLMSMVAGGSKISQVHQYALVALTRIFVMSKETKTRG